MGFLIRGEVFSIDELNDKLSENLPIGSTYVFDGDLYTFDGSRFILIGSITTPSKEKLPFNLR